MDTLHKHKVQVNEVSIVQNEISNDCDDMKIEGDCDNKDDAVSSCVYILVWAIIG